VYTSLRGAVVPAPESLEPIVEKEELQFPGSFLIEVADEVARLGAAVTASTLERRDCCGFVPQVERAIPTFPLAGRVVAVA
jgi:hypothetical protein